MGPPNTLTTSHNISQHPHNTLTTSPNTLTAPSKHPHNTLKTPSQHPQNISQYPHKYRLEKIAEAERQKVVLEAEAEAEATALRGEAEAYAIEVKAKAEAEKEYKEAALVDMMLKVLPKVAAEVAGPISETNKITMVSTGDGPIGASRVTNEVLEIMGSLPDTVKKMTGVDITTRMAQA